MATSSAPDPPLVVYTDGRALMAHGSEALHSHVAQHMELAIGKGLPRMEVRFHQLTVSAELPAPVSGDGPTKTELPTIFSEFKAGLRGLLPGHTRTVTKTILTNVSGVLKPGTMTLVLGQPGSGKSSLLKMLSGRFPITKNVSIEGDVTYNNLTQTDLATRLPQFVSLVTQQDSHFPTLTVKETLEFAHECCGAELSEREANQFTKGTPEQNTDALEVARAMNRHFPEVVIQQLGLEKCQDTVVGNGMQRGVSGGERKRVTTGEMAFGNKVVCLMDEISTGLDSAATFDIVKTQRSLAKRMRKTVVIGLLQPSPEVFALFDNVILLNKGRVMYNGPRSKVLQYFEMLGFQCPPTRDIADFLLDLGTEQQQQYEDHATKRNGPTPRTAFEFGDRFEASSIHQDAIRDLLAPYDPELLLDVEHHFNFVPEFHQSYWASTWALMKRDVTVTLRNHELLKGRAIMICGVALLYASLFYQVNPQDTFVMMGTLFTVILMLSLGQAALLPDLMDARTIFYKQRGANFYRTSCYVLSRSASVIPFAMIETIVTGSLVYFMCGLVSNVEAFIIFELLLFSTILAFAGWFLLLSAISPSLHVADPLALLSVLVYILFAGFLMTEDAIPDYFVWLYWLNPISWCLRSLAINQYGASEFNVCEYGGIKYCDQFGMKMGEYALDLFKLPSDKVWVWYGLLYILMLYVVFMVLSIVALENIRYENPENVSLDDAIELVDSECVPSENAESYEAVQTPRSEANVCIANSDQRCVKPVTLAFKDLWYSVPNPSNKKEDLELLKGISGFAMPGTITALMGSTGAGKTTLMDVIAGRKTGGKIRGNILLNGHPATDLAIRRATGYCEQTDVHSDASTIRESLVFSAFLRQGCDIPDSEKYESVEECLDLLHLRPIADQIVRGSSVEQLKRLTIGVELVAQPSVLFLDEPTSGLDARAAKLIMDGVRRVADSGRTVVCTIHQPSWEVFQVFDNLLLLKRGGETVYSGDVGKDASELVNYFESIPGTPPLKEGYNPATWMLEVIGAGVGNSQIDETDFVQVFNASEKSLLLESNLNKHGVGIPAEGVEALGFTSKRAASEWTQAKFLTRRMFDLYWRTPSFNLTRLVIYIALGLIFGLSFLGLDYETYQGLNAGVGTIFMTTIFVGVVTMEGVVVLASELRLVYYRERASQTYNTFWYVVATTIVEIPYVVAISFLFCATFFPLAGFTGVTRFLLYWFHTSINVLVLAYIGQFIAAIVPRVEVGIVAGVVVTNVNFLFMGYSPPAASIPSGYQWLNRIVPSKYAAAIVGSLVFGDCPSGDATSTALGCKHLKGLPPTFAEGTSVQRYVEDVFEIKRDEIWFNFGVLIVYLALLRGLALLALRYVNHQKR